jgi:hypothetical protein
LPWQSHTSLQLHAAAGGLAAGGLAAGVLAAGGLAAGVLAAGGSAIGAVCVGGFLGVAGSAGFGALLQAAHNKINRADDRMRSSYLAFGVATLRCADVERCG